MALLVETLGKFISVKLQILDSTFTEFTALNFGKSVKTVKLGSTDSA
jgi:hypothetical protein